MPQDYSIITPEEIHEIKESLRKRPVDHSWDEEDEYWHANLPGDETMARLQRSMLRDLDEWDEENDCPKP